MFDFGQILEKAAGLIGNGSGLQDIVGGNVADALGGNLSEILGNAGIDPSLLENMSLDQATDFLANAGIDPAALGEGGIADLLDRFRE